jgi:hypothetical protein
MAFLQTKKAVSDWHFDLQWMTIQYMARQLSK